MVHWNVSSATHILMLLLDISIRGLVLAGACWLILRLFRVRSACIRHAFWTAVLLGMMAMPVLRSALPSVPINVLPATSAVFLSKPLAPVSALEKPPGSGRENPGNSSPTQSSPAAPQPRWALLILMLYAAVAAILLVRQSVGGYLACRLVRRSREIRLDDSLAMAHGESFLWGTLPRICESSLVQVPVTVSLFSPTIILPSDWATWKHEKLRAVIAHEVSHVQRRDFITQNLSALNKSLFWFHPLAWWLDRQLKVLAEEASDNCALNVTPDRHDYADVLLSFAVRAQQAGRRVRWQGLAMAGRRPMSQRIERILDPKNVSSLRLSRRMVISLFVFVPLLAGSMAAVQPISKAIVRASVTKPFAAQLKNVNIDSFLGKWQGTQGPLHVSIELRKLHGKLTGIVSSRFVQNRPVLKLEQGAVRLPPPPPPPLGGWVLHPQLQGDTLTFTVEPSHGAVETHYRLKLETRGTASANIASPNGVDLFRDLKLTKLTKTK